MIGFKTLELDSTWVDVQIPRYPLCFSRAPTSLWNYMVQKVENKLSYWMTKKLSLAGRFQICFKVLASTYVYYSSCWFPSKNCYKTLEKLLKAFLLSNTEGKKGFHRVAYEKCCIPKSFSGMGLFDFQRQDFALCAKWIVKCL